MRAGRALRRLVLARVRSEVSGLDGRVYDRAPTGAAYPYATLGPSDWTRQDADCIDGRLWSLQIDIWHSAAAKGELEDMVDDAAAALQGFEADDVPMHPFSVTLARVMNDPNGDLHGVVQIEAMLEDA